MSALFERLTGLALRDPAALWIAALVAVAAALLAIGRRRAPALRFSPLALFAGSAAGRDAGPLPRTARTTLAGTPRALGAVALALLAVALARPVRRTDAPVVTEGVDVVLCLDASSSMAEADMEAGRSRLDVAKEAAERFVRGRPNDRVGLVTFARWPDLRCPPTRDHDALVAILREVVAVRADGPEDATGIGTAVARAAQSLASGGAASRVVVLLTDGEETVATAPGSREIAPDHAAQLAQRLGVRVHAIVAGTGRRAPDGTVTPPDAAALARLAARTGGAAFAARDAAAMAAVWARIDAMERTAFAQPRTEYEDRFVAFLAAGFGLLLLARFLEASVWAVAP